MSNATTVRLKGSAWQAIANEHKGAKSPFKSYADSTAYESDADLLLDLAVRHFEDQVLTPGEGSQLAANLLHTAATGETREVKPVGVRDRAYRFRRHVGGVSIRAGEGQIRLPIRSALRLAGILPQLGRAAAFAQAA